jgi:hypothetical protein
VGTITAFNHSLLAQEEEYFIGSRDKNNGLTFQFDDDTKDVRLIEKKFDNYTDSIGYDIKSISTEQSGDKIWLNMSMYDLVEDAVGIYYKMYAGDTEVIFYRGDGTISYPDGSTEFSVEYTTQEISAALLFTKMLLENFEVYARVYLEDSDETYGQYTIFDEILDETGDLEINKIDARDDVKRSYIYTETVTEESNIDIVSSQIVDTGESLKLTLTFRGNVESSAEVSYKIMIGKATFEYVSGVASIKYFDAPKNTISVDITDNSISTSFNKNKLDLSNKVAHIESKHKPSVNQEYIDDLENELPRYLYAMGEQKKLEISMFDKDSVVMELSGKLNITNTIQLRYYIDEDGNNNNVVEQSELDDFVNRIYTQYTVYEFFEFQPYVDSVPGQPSYKIAFKNLTGKASEFLSAELTITGLWEFNLYDADELEIRFKIFTGFIPENAELGFIFEIVYSDVVIKFSSGFKYWELQSSEIFPEQFKAYTTTDGTMFFIPAKEYYQLKNNIDESDFGFTIKYNETAAKLDSNGKKKNDTDNGFSSMFLPILIIASGLVIILIIIIARKRRK